MGSPEDEPGRLEGEVLHEVVLSEGYWLADTCCTQVMWRSVMGKSPSSFAGDNQPVESISWDNVQTFLNKINKEYPELQLALPTEAQWEYACRAGTDTPFSFGEIDRTRANYFDGPEDAGYSERAKGKTVSVATFAANPWGLYDMHGNVWEWCHDWYGKYQSSGQLNPVGPADGEARVLRGGGWFFNARYCRSASRIWNGPSRRDDFVGFRFAQVDRQPAAQRQPVEG